MKHKRRSQAPKKGKKNTYSHQVLSETQLRDHVASQYVHGPGGSMRGALAREKATKDMEHMKHLHKLNRHPALLLNADYMVRTYVTRACLNYSFQRPHSIRSLILKMTLLLLHNNHDIQRKAD